MIGGFSENMTRRAFLARRVIAKHGKSGVNMAIKKNVNFCHKNQYFSKFVNAFHSGSIFHPSLGHKLSSDAFFGSILLS